MATKYGSGSSGRDDLDRVAAEASARTGAKVASGKTQRSKEVLWHQLVTEKYPHALPEVFDAAAKNRLAMLEEAWGWDRMVRVMRWGIADWKALRMDSADRKYDQLEATPNFRQFYALRDRISSRWADTRAREDNWQRQQRQSRERLMEIQKAWTEVKKDSPGFTAMRKVIDDLQERMGLKRAS